MAVDRAFTSAAHSAGDSIGWTRLELQSFCQFERLDIIVAFGLLRNALRNVKGILIYTVWGNYSVPSWDCWRAGGTELAVTVQDSNQ
jgi:hypothetical protein